MLYSGLERQRKGREGPGRAGKDSKSQGRPETASEGWGEYKEKKEKRERRQEVERVGTCLSSDKVLKEAGAQFWGKGEMQGLWPGEHRAHWGLVTAWTSTEEGTAHEGSISRH